MESPRSRGDEPPAAHDYASLRARGLARILDLLLFVALVLLLRGIRVRRGDCALIFACREGEVTGVATAWTIADYLTGFAYNWLMIAFHRGQTVGKMLTGVRIARPDGRALGVLGAAKREATAFASALVLGLGFVWAVGEGERRTWHDRVAGSRAFRAR